ncbi:MAG: C25 family cysteine peptidase, partial [Thermoplasmatota archaeon]
MPTKPIYILLPPDAEYESVEVKTRGRTPLGEGILVEPVEEPQRLPFNPPDIPPDMVPPQDIPEETMEKPRLPTPDEEIYGSQQPFPREPYEVVGVQKWRGYTVLIVNLYPVEYIPAPGKLFYYNDMTVTVHTAPSTFDNALYRGKVSDEMLIKEKVINPGMTTSYKTMATDTTGTESEPAPLGGSGGGTLPADPSESYEYVIITTEDLDDTHGTYNFQDLIDDKISRGMTATIVTVENITSTPQYWDTTSTLFNDTMAQIRRFIRDAYLNWGTEYVLLGGDTHYVAGPPGYIPWGVLGDNAGYTDIPNILYISTGLSGSAMIYHDGQSQLLTSDAANIAMASSDDNIYMVFDRYNSTTGHYDVAIKYDNPDGQKDIEYYYNQYYLWNDFSYDGKDPDVGAAGSNVVVVYMEDSSGNWDIRCEYSTNDGASFSTSYPAWTTDDEMHPAVYVTNSIVYLAYVNANDGHVYYVTSYDGGATWGTPTQVDTSGMAVAENGTVDVDPAGVVWTDSRNGNKDVYFWSSSAGEHAVYTNTEDDYCPQLVTDSYGNLLIGRTRRMSTYDTDVDLLYSTDGGYSWMFFNGNPYSGIDGNQTGPDLVYDGVTGNIYGAVTDEYGVWSYLFKIEDVTSWDFNDIWYRFFDTCTASAITNWTEPIDESGVPARSLYVDGTYMPSDLYYACLDGSYNYDGDENWGEAYEDGDEGQRNDVDLFAEVYVGRAPVDDATEVSNFVQKTLNYADASGEYLKNISLVGEFLDFGGAGNWGGNHMDQLVDGSSAHGYTTQGFPSDDYDISRTYDRFGEMQTITLDLTPQMAFSSYGWIRFCLYSDGSWEQAGFYIDNVEIITDGTYTMFYDDMEGGEGAWVHGGTNDEWELGAPIRIADVYGGVPSSGTNCWATDLDDTYEQDCNPQQWLEIDLDFSSNSTVTLSFDTWYATERYPDYVGVLVANISGYWEWAWWDRGCNGWESQALIDEMNQGTHIVNHLGHAGFGYVMKMYNDDVSSVTTDENFFIYSQGCNAGGFDNPYGYDCIAEEFVTSPHGAFGAIMNAR